MSSIYHYCTVESFKSILEHKTIRLSDISKSNDPNEIKFIYDGYLDWFIKNNIKNEKYLKEIVKRQAKFNNEIEKATFLVSCFSKIADDLHMWNCYANKGVCIEFDREKLEKHINLFHGENNISFKNESFDDDFNKLVIEDIIYLNKKNLEETFNEHFHFKMSKFEEQFLFKLAPMCKNDFFKCEKEVRIIYRFIEKEGNKCILNNKLNYLEFKDSNEKISFKSITTNNYLHKMVLDLPIDMTFIKSITIGPNCNLSIKDIYELLFIFKVTHLNEKDIKKSKGSLR